MKKIILNIEGMSCSACSTGLEKYLNKQPGIINSYVNLVLAQASIEYNDNLTINDLNNYIKEAGFKSLGVYDEALEYKYKKDAKNLIIFGVLSILIIYITMGHMIKFPIISFLDMTKYPINYSVCLLLLTIPYLIYGRDIFKSGYKNICHKTPNMDTLVTIGVLASFLYSLFGTIMILLNQILYVEKLYFESACIVIYFIKLGRYIDSNNKEKTKEAIKDLVTITPNTALLKIKDGYKEITIDEVKVGDILVCLPGMKIAVDGTITFGTTHTDESFITGEAMPVKKNIGKKVIAGSYNIDGKIEYMAEKIGKDSTISEIVRLVIEATNTKAPIAKVADKVSGIFVPSIMIIAIFTFIIYLLLNLGITTALTHFINILVVACPCALGLATPLAIVVSEGLCAKNGILVKTSETLENIHKVNTIIFDKTGTLTYGALRIAKIYNYSSNSDKDIIKIVSSIEKYSTHPIANAFRNDYNNLEVKDFNNIAGLGVKATINNKKYYIGNSKLLAKEKINNNHETDETILKNMACSIIYVIEDNKIIALIGVKDTTRKDAKQTIRILKSLNKEVIMLTGDNEITAKIIAKELGIDNVIANVLPKEKTNKVKELMTLGKMVAMVGDGINDAPSLATADIGISLSSGTDIANNSANVILINNNLMNLVNLILISKKTIINIKENLFWAFFYNICMIPIACGILSNIGINMNPMIAGIAMTISSLTVMLNALRLKKIKLRRD